MPRKSAGFTLIEVMIVVGIVAILASIAVPAYQSYLMRGRIPEATSALASARARLEQYYQDNRRYDGLLTTPIETTYFSVTTKDASNTETATATGYTLRAVGKGPMTGFEFTVDQRNARSSSVTGVSGWDGNATCWITRKGGVC